MKRIVLIILIILMMGLIFKFSSYNGKASSSQSKGLLEKSIGYICEIFNSDISDEKIDEIYLKWKYPIRKFAHVSEYFILSILVCLFFCTYDMNYKKIIFYTFLVCFLYACSDEVHQLFVPGRNGNIFDVFVDSIGICLPLVIYYFSERRIDV